MDGLSVQRQAHWIAFTGDGFTGELFYGTEGEPFSRHGVEIHAKGVDGSKIANEISSRVMKACASHVSGSARAK